MHKTCDECGRSPLKGNSRSHSNVATRKWQKLNLQSKTIKGKVCTLCTRCIRSLNRKKAKA